MNAFAIVVLFAAGGESAVHDHVDLIEINRVWTYDSNDPQLEQIVFWRWSQSWSRYYVVDWRLLKSEAQIPVRVNGRWQADWWDCKDNVWRRTTARLVTETDTLYDTELNDRRIYPEDQRAKLKKR